MLTVGGLAFVTLNTQEIPWHLHDITHTHPQATSGERNLHHVHTFPGGSVPVIAGSGLGGGLGGAGLGTPIPYTDDATPTPGSADMTHSHTVDVPAFSGTSGGNGGGLPHYNIQPFTVVNFIIKY
jgi:microcystin-dependent protein